MYFVSVYSLFFLNIIVFLLTVAVNTVRPANANPSNPGGQVQNLQIIQGPSGQLQVRGLLPGNAFSLLCSCKSIYFYSCRSFCHSVLLNQKVVWTILFQPSNNDPICCANKDSLTLG